MSTIPAAGGGSKGRLPSDIFETEEPNLLDHTPEPQEESTPSGSAGSGSITFSTRPTSNATPITSITTRSSTGLRIVRPTGRGRASIAMSGSDNTPSIGEGPSRWHRRSHPGSDTKGYSRFTSFHFTRGLRSADPIRLNLSFPVQKFWIQQQLE